MTLIHYCHILSLSSSLECLSVCVCVYLEQGHVLAVILLALLGIGAVNERAALFGVRISC